MHILIPVDRSEQSTRALALVLGQERITEHEHVNLITVHPHIPMSITHFLGQADIERFYREQTDEVYARPNAMMLKAGVDLPKLVATGDPVDELAHYINTNPVDLVVMGAHGQRNFAGSLFGSVSRGVLGHTKVPVLLVRDTIAPAGKPWEVGICVDDSVSSRAAVDFVLKNRAFFGLRARFRLIHAGGKAAAPLPVFAGAKDAANPADQYSPAWHKVVDPIAQRCAEAGLLTENIALTGPTATAISDYVNREKLDLLVTGSHGHSELRRLFIGTTTAGIAAHTQIPLLIVR